MLYNQIVCTVSSVLKSKLSQSQISQIKSSEIYSYYLALEYSTPKSQSKLFEYYPFSETLD